MPGARPDSPPGPGPLGDVIHLDHRRAAGPVMPVDGNAAYQPRDDVSAEQSLAVTVEALFAQRHRTLTDPQTAEAFHTSLDAVQLLLSGARAQGVLGEEAYTELTSMLAHMRSAPDFL